MAGGHRRPHPGAAAAASAGDRRRIRVCVLSQIADRVRAVRRHRYLGGGRSTTLRQLAGANQIPWRDRVQLLARPAHITDALPRGHFDTIVVNSVVQYFPNAAYLTEVVDNAMELLAPGGTLFVGDVRNHTLQNAFQSGIASARRSPRMPPHPAAGAARGARRTRTSAAPEFFTTWADGHASVAGVDIQVERGTADNELSRYRYDVTIHKTHTRRAAASTPRWTMREWTAVTCVREKRC